MKHTKKIYLSVCLLPLLAPLASCSGGTVVNDENTINIKMYLGGYGTEWMNSLIEKFEETYKAEGYKVNLLKPSTSNTGSAIINELASGYNKNKIDLYFTRSVLPQKVVDGDYGLLVQDLTDLVYSQKAISFDGSEESKTIADKLDPSFDEEWYKYNGKAYNFLYVKSVGGLVVNKEKLESFGLELPVTTNELLNCIHTIHEKYANGETKIQPFTLIGSGTNGYPAVMMNSWFTQYSGVEGWNAFWSMTNSDGSYNKDNGYKVFEDDGLHKAAELVYTVFDQQNIVKGAASNDLDTAHADIMNKGRGAVFMFDGDWMLNEASVDSTTDELKKLTFINVPVISDLGTKLWGSTYSDEVCETILSKVVKLSDDNKSSSEIVSTVKTDLNYDITESSVIEVAKARGVYNNRGVETGNCYMPVGISEKNKEIASKFLRMFASDDFANVYSSVAHAASPYSSGTSTAYEYEFQKGHSNIVNHQYATGIWPLAKGLRNKIAALGSMFPIAGSQIHDYAFKSTLSEYTDGVIDSSKAGTYRTASEARLTTEYENVKTNWSKWMENA